MSHEHRGLHQGIVGHEMHRSPTFRRRKIQEHLPDQLRQQGAVLASREPYDPGHGVILLVLTAKVCSYLVQPRREISRGLVGGHESHAATVG